MPKRSAPPNSLPDRRRKRHRKEAPAQQEIEATIATIDQIQPRSLKVAQALMLLRTWLADTSGYDEEAWPTLKDAMERERERQGARALFDG